MDNCTEYESGFKVFKVESGERVDVCPENENAVIFVLRGKIRTLYENKKIIMSEGHMYCMSKEVTFRIGYALNDTLFICMDSNALIPYTDLKRVLKAMEARPIEFYELKFNHLVTQYLHSILLLKESQITSRTIYDLKKQELLFILRYSFTNDELTRFIAPSISSKSEFKIMVYSKYTNSISVQEFAEKCFMTPKTFTKHFKDEFKTTPYKWMLKKRIKNLRNDIYYKSYSIDNLLEEYGFSSETELKKFCKRYNLDDLIKMLK